MKIQGGRSAHDELYRKTRRDLLPAIERLIPDQLRKRWDPEDLYHEAFLRTVARLDEFEWRGESSWRGYVLTTAKNCVRDAVRRRSFINVHIEHGDAKGGVRVSRIPAEGPPVSEIAGRVDLIEHVFAGMTDADVQLLKLKLLEGRGDQEIAERLDKSVAAVRKAVQRAKARFVEIAATLDAADEASSNESADSTG